MSRYIKLSGIILFFVLVLSSSGFSQTQTEQLIITTYYPSPYGSYRQLRVDQATAGQNGLLVNLPAGAETTASGIRVFGYSPAIELMDKDSVQNWYIGIDDNDSNKFLIGRGYGPGQGVAQAITIDDNDRVGIGGDSRAADRLAVYGRVSTNFAGAGTRQMFSFDLAEDIPAAPDVGAADVVVIDSAANERVIKSTKPYDAFVAGVISTSPAFHIAMPDGKTPLALAGRVLCKATTKGGGPIKRGDLLVTSSKPGYAMKGDPKKIQIGTVLGKAMQPLEKGDGKIMILVTLQ